MADNVFVIADVSGKMHEIGKDETVKYLLLTVHSLFQNAALEPIYFGWSSELFTIEDLINIKFDGRTDVTALEGLLEDLPENSRIMLISDGNYSASSIIKIIKRRMFRTAAVSVGADASPRVLGSLCTAGSPFNGCDISAAVSYLSRG